MKFNYRGVGRNYEVKEGVIHATDRDEARKKLRALEIRPIEIRKNHLEINLKINALVSPAVNLKGLIIFTRQLSSLISSGVTIVMALDILSEQEKRPAFKKVLIAVKEHIESGGGFSEVLERYPKTFPELFVRVIEAGEIAGSLENALNRIGIQLDKLNAIRRKVVAALIYPAITVVVAFGVISFLLAKVVPEIVSMYGDKSKLPEITLFVIDISNWFQQNWLVVFLGIGGSLFGFKSAYAFRAVKELIDPLLLKIPVIKLLIIRSNIAILTRTLSILVMSGVQLLTAFQICEKIVSNTVVKRCVRNAASSVMEGLGIANGLSQVNIIPPMVVHMVKIGELTGKLDELLLKIAEIYDEELDDAVSLMTTLLQPMLIVGVGGIIMVIMVAIYLPLFGMSSNM